MACGQEPHAVRPTRSVCIQISFVSVRMQNIYVVFEQQLSDLPHRSRVPSSVAVHILNCESLPLGFGGYLRTGETRIAKHRHEAMAIVRGQLPGQPDKHVLRTVVPLATDKKENGHDILKGFSLDGDLGRW